MNCFGKFTLHFGAHLPKAKAGLWNAEVLLWSGTTLVFSEVLTASSSMRSYSSYWAIEFLFPLRFPHKLWGGEDMAMAENSDIHLLIQPPISSYLRNNPKSSLTRRTSIVVASLHSTSRPHYGGICLLWVLSPHCSLGSGLLQQPPWKWLPPWPFGYKALAGISGPSFTWPLGTRQGS